MLQIRKCVSLPVPSPSFTAAGRDQKPTLNKKKDQRTGPRVDSGVNALTETKGLSSCVVSVLQAAHRLAVDCVH